MEAQTSKRAIVIEDDKALRSVISGILKKRGYEVHVASEPSFCPIFLEEPCSCPEGHTCTSILITDVKMPNMSGFEFLQKQKDRGCKVQNIAVMSAAWKESELAFFRGLGCKILRKPFKLSELVSWLEACEHQTPPDYKLADLPRPI